MTDAVILRLPHRHRHLVQETLTETSAYDLAGAVVVEPLRRSGLVAAGIDDVVLGEGHVAAV